MGTILRYEQISFSASKCVDDVVVKRGSQLIGLALDDASSAQPLAIVRHHCKLVIEHVRAHTPTDRWREIIGEIQNLRSARDTIIEVCDGHEYNNRKVHAD